MNFITYLALFLVLLSPITKAEFMLNSSITVGSVFEGEYACRSADNKLNDYLCSFIGKDLKSLKLVVSFQPKDPEILWKQCSAGNSK